jgi:hypothetical protein
MRVLNRINIADATVDTHRIVPNVSDPWSTKTTNYDIINKLLQVIFQCLGNRGVADSASKSNTSPIFAPE